MASVAILVNGLAASGKTTLATALGALLDCPVLTKDLLKERYAEMMGLRADGRRLGALAMETLWRLGAETDGGVIVDAVLPRDRDLEHTRRGLEIMGSPRVVEVWCEVPFELARERYIARTPSRAAVHPPWSDEALPIEPLGAWPLVQVDTTRDVDLAALVLELERLFTAPIPE